MNGDVLRPDRGIRNSLTGFYALTAEDQMYRIPGLRFSRRERESVFSRDDFDRLEIMAVDHDVDVFRISDRGWLNPVHVKHHSAAADEFMRDVFLL